MGKRSRYTKEMMKDIPKKIFDEEAYSIAELALIVSPNLSTTNRFAQKMVKSGRWEQVFKYDRLGRPTRAFRPKK